MEYANLRLPVKLCNHSLPCPSSVVQQIDNRTIHLAYVRRLDGGVTALLHDFDSCSELIKTGLRQSELSLHLFNLLDIELIVCHAQQILPEPKDTQVLTSKDVTTHIGTDLRQCALIVSMGIDRFCSLAILTDEGRKCQTEITMIALMTTEDVARFARVTTKTVYVWIKDGANGKRLKVHRLPGGGYRINPSDLEDFLGFETTPAPTMQTTVKG